MKRIIYGMSMSRKKAHERMEGLSSNLNEHIIECVVYKNIRNKTISHWVDEISSWMYAINNIKCDSKLKERDYINFAFCEFGNEPCDAEVNLFSYRGKNLMRQYKNQYPDFEITDELVNELFRCYQDVIEISLPILISKNVLTTFQWKKLLLPIFQ